MNTHRIEADVRHARLIAGSMRPRDVDEVRAGWNREPLEAMREALSASYFARTMFCGFEPLLMYGLAPLTVIGGSARVWLFSSAAIDRHPRAFVRGCRDALPEFFQHCNLATNLIDISDEPAMRWMKWLGGACVLPPHDRGGRLFAQFILVDRFKAEKRACRQA